MSGDMITVAGSCVRCGSKARRLAPARDLICPCLIAPSPLTPPPTRMRVTIPKET